MVNSQGIGGVARRSKTQSLPSAVGFSEASRIVFQSIAATQHFSASLYRTVADVGEAKKLIFYVWTTLQHQINFEFKDLLLP